jgi:hypothetical protein
VLIAAGAVQQDEWWPDRLSAGDEQVGMGCCGHRQTMAHVSDECT